MLAWYFIRDSGRLGFYDDRRVQVGVTHTVDSEICKDKGSYGLYAAQNLVLAMQIVPERTTGNVALVELSGKIFDDEEHQVYAEKRKYLAIIDLNLHFHEFIKTLQVPWWLPDDAYMISNRMYPDNIRKRRYWVARTCSFYEAVPEGMHDVIVNTPLHLRGKLMNYDAYNIQNKWLAKKAVELLELEGVKGSLLKRVQKELL